MQLLDNTATKMFGLYYLDCKGVNMTVKEMWEAYIYEYPCYKEKDYEAWTYGSDTPDLLAELTLSGKKTATASEFSFYEYEKCDLPKAGNHSIIMNTKGTAVCIIKTLNVDVVPFHKVSAEFAYKEGEGDRSLAYWRQVHTKFFKEELKKINIEFTEDMLVVCEEFEVVFPKIK